MPQAHSIVMGVRGVWCDIVSSDQKIKSQSVCQQILCTRAERWVNIRIINCKTGVGPNVSFSNAIKKIQHKAMVCFI